MTQSPLYKRAFVRGLNAHLMQVGEVAYTSKEAADYAADFVADNTGMPDPYFEGDKVSLKVASDLCISLSRAADALNAQTGGASAELSKQAAAIDPVAQATVDASNIMHKIAYETEGPNSVEAAAAHSSQAALDAHNRPAGYANTGVGNYIDKGRGQVGVEEQVQHGAPTEGGSNSPIENTSKMGGVLKAAAAGGRTGTAPNTVANAAAHSDQAALDNKNRPAGYANTGVGKTSLTASGSAVLGAETSVKPKDKPMTGSNSVSAPKTAAERHLERTAALLIQFLPTALTDVQKVAHIRACAALTPAQQVNYLTKVASVSGIDQATVAQIPDAFFSAVKTASEGEDDYEVAQALEAAAAELGNRAEHKEDAAVRKLTEEKTAAALAQLSAATARVA